MSSKSSVTGLILLIRWLIRLPAQPDPWEKADTRENLLAEAVPICLNCSEPVVNSHQHYCPKCGKATGEFTPYVPICFLYLKKILFPPQKI